MQLFRKLSEAEQQEYRQWARDNYKVGSPINGVYHPVVQAECVKMNAEADAGGEIMQPIVEALAS